VLLRATGRQRVRHDAQLLAHHCLGSINRRKVTGDCPRTSTRARSALRGQRCTFGHGGGRTQAGRAAPVPRKPSAATRIALLASRTPTRRVSRPSRAAASGHSARAITESRCRRLSRYLSRTRVERPEPGTRRLRDPFGVPNHRRSPLPWRTPTSRHDHTSTGSDRRRGCFRTMRARRTRKTPAEAARPRARARLPQKKMTAGLATTTGLLNRPLHGLPRPIRRFVSFQQQGDRFLRRST